MRSQNTRDADSVLCRQQEKEGTPRYRRVASPVSDRVLAFPMLPISIILSTRPCSNVNTVDLGRHLRDQLPYATEGSKSFSSCSVPVVQNFAQISFPSTPEAILRLARPATRTLAHLLLDHFTRGVSAEIATTQRLAESIERMQCSRRRLVAVDSVPR